MAVLKTIQTAEQRMLIKKLQESEQLADRNGLHITARAIRNALGAVGWEICGEVEKAEKQSRGERA